ncbi:hypothetical protein BDR06DRAFT_964722 [Suillus hirtellus]|nr:hypothetical protein BDR06DRAFT_964722 [Suillus hirtellus]
MASLLSALCASHRRDSVVVAFSAIDGPVLHLEVLRLTDWFIIQKRVAHQCIVVNAKRYEHSRLKHPRFTHFHRVKQTRILAGPMPYAR